MTKCILHVGMHKTGTTSIQNSLKDLDDELFYYARVGSTPNHSITVYSIFANNPASHRMNKTRHKMKSFVQNLRSDLKSSIQAARGRTLVISGEGLIRLQRDELVKLQRFLGRQGYDEIDVVAYIRPPAGFLSSATQQRIKGGTFKTFEVAKSAPSYRAKFRKFDKVFGRGNVRLFKFDPAAFHKNDVVLDFCHKVGIPESSITVLRKNESISKIAAQIIYQYSQISEEEGLPPIRGGMSEMISKTFEGIDTTKFRLSPNVLRPILEDTREDTEWMEKRLGQSLAEVLDQERPEDIKSEDDLLSPVAGVTDVLLQRLAKLGIKVPEDQNLGTWRLLGLFISAERRRQKEAEEASEAADSNGSAEEHSKAETAGTEPSQPMGLNKGESSSHPALQAGKPARNLTKRAAPPAEKQESTPAGHRGAARAAGEASKRGGAAPAERDRPMSIIGKPWKPPLTDTPRPMINSRKQVMVLWSPKSACTTTYVWFSHVSGFLSQVRKYAAWPHKHRTDIYEKSKLYNESVEADLSGLRSVRVIRDPYSRAVSIYRHALQTNFANKSLAEYQSGKWSLDEGMSFQQFLDFVATLDMVNVDIHFRPQFHSFEAVHTPTRVINISKQDLFAGLNAFERDAGLPETDFKAFDWLHDLEGKRKALHVPLEGENLDQMRFNRKIVSEGQFPSYSQLLTPEAKQKIEAIYNKDFSAYRDFL